MPRTAGTVSSRSTTIDQPDALKSLARQAATRCFALAWRTLALIAVALMAVALMATPTQASTIFYDDFEDDGTGGNPVINTSAGNIGSSWDNEVSPGVTVLANPFSTGNTSATVLQLHHKGEMDGNLSSGILLDGTTLSTDFYIDSDNASNKITMKFRRADGTGPFNLNLKQNGDVTGGSTVGLLGITHYGADVWQNATWSFAYNGTSNLWDVDLSFTNLATNDTTSDTFTDLALAVTASDIFTEITPKGQATGSMYVDNIQVVIAGGTPIPEPSTGLLLGIGLAGLGMRRRGSLAG